MFFKLELTVVGLRIRLEEGESVKFPINAESNVVVELRLPNSDELKAGHKTTDAFCTISREYNVSPEVAAVFESLNQRKIPEGSFDPHSEKWGGYLDDSGFIKEKHILPLYMLPNVLQEFRKTLWNEMYNVGKQTIMLISWRKGLFGRHNPFTIRNFQWSFYGEEWTSMPHEVSMEISAYSPFKITKEENMEIMDMVVSASNEPIYHNFFREAWYAYEDRNYRSALVLGVAAAEVGIKTLISDVVPDSRWLVENMPSPRINDILQKYLPTLPVRLKINDETIIPKNILTSLEAAVKLRNSISHKGNSEIDRKKAKKHLLDIRDLLWLLDYYRGFSWALEHLSDGCKKRIGS